MTSKSANSADATHVWIEANVVNASTALFLISLAHAHPTLSLRGLIISEQGDEAAAAATRAANVLKISGLQHVPVYTRKPHEAEEKQPHVSSSASSSSVVDGRLLLQGSRYPPLAAHAIHTDSLLKAWKDSTEKTKRAVVVVAVECEPSMTVEAMRALEEEQNAYAAAVAAAAATTSSAPPPPAAAAIVSRIVISEQYAAALQQLKAVQDKQVQVTAVNAASVAIPDQFVSSLLSHASSFSTPYGNLLYELVNTLSTPEVARHSINCLALLQSLLPSSDSLISVVQSSLSKANELSHINKVRKSKAPPQKVLKPGQQAYAAGFSSCASCSSMEECAPSSGPLVSYPKPGALPANPTPFPQLPESSPLNGLQRKITQNVTNMLLDSLLYDVSKGEHLFILYDQDTELSRLIARGYRNFIEQQQLKHGEQATFLNFHDESPEILLGRLFNLKAGDSVILIQSQQFRLNDYRIRLELFKRNIRSIEHVHCNIIAPSEFEPYIDALAFSPKDYGALAYSMKSVVDAAGELVVTCKDGLKCVYSKGMQPCKLNIGDYRHMAQKGGTYPIGEVFTESLQIDSVNGFFSIFAHPSLQKTLTMLPKGKNILLEVKKGVVQFDESANPPILPKNCTPEFLQLLRLIRDGEGGEVVVREFGLGLNRGMSPEPGRTVNDIFAFERQHGLHISLGKKHNVFKADGIKQKDAVYHIDIFVDIETISCDGKNLWEGGEYHVPLTHDYQGNLLSQSSSSTTSA